MAKAKIRYRKVSVRMWGDEKFRRLSAPPPNGRTLWIYLLTGPESGVIPGVVVGGEAGLAEALGWSLKGFREAFAEVERERIAEADWSSRLVWVPKAVVHNPPQSTNVIRSWAEALELVPDCALKWKAVAGLKAFVDTMPEGFRKAFVEAFPEALAKALPEALPEGMAYPGAVAVAGAGAGAVTGSSKEEPASGKPSAKPSPPEAVPAQQPAQPPDPPPPPPKAPPLSAADVERLKTAADVVHASALRVPGLLAPESSLEWDNRRPGEIWKLYGICDRLKVDAEFVLGVVHWLVADSFWQPKVPDAAALERQWKSILGAMNSKPAGGGPRAPDARRGVLYTSTDAEFEEMAAKYGRAT